MPQATATPSTRGPHAARSSSPPAPSQPQPARRALWLSVLLSAGLIVVGLGWRMPWLLAVERTLDADEAVTGIMAMDILDGARPLYYYGQGYLGTVEPFTAAGLFAVLGSSPLVLRLAPLLIFVASLWFQYRVVRHWFGRPAAWLSVLFWCAAPAAVALWTVKARGGFTAVMLFGMILTWIYQRATTARPIARWRWLAAGGVVLGLGWWTNAMVTYYVMPLAGLVWRRIRAAERAAAGSPRSNGITPRQWIGAAASFVLGLAVGLAPVIAYRLSPVAVEGRQLFNPAPSAWLAGIGRLATELLPVLFDFNQTWLGLAPAVVLACLLAICLRAAARVRETSPAIASDPNTAASDGVVYTALLWLAVPGVVLLSNQATDVHGFRYLLPLFSAVSISLGWLVAHAWRFRGMRPILATLGAVVWLAHCSHSVLAHRADELAPVYANDVASAAAYADVSAIATPYWDCYRITFLTDRQVVGVPCRGPVRDDRAVQQWRQQQDFAALVLPDQVSTVTAAVRNTPAADAADLFPAADRMLVVIRPGSQVAWPQRRAALFKLVAELDEQHPTPPPSWPALK